MPRIKAISALTMALLVAGLLAPQGASANTANGRCSKSGATAKIGGKSYLCVQNPTVTAKRLTWTLKECLEANTAHLRSLKSFNETESSSQKVLENLDASIAARKAQVPIDNERAAKELESAKQNRDLSIARQKEADDRFAKAKTVGVAAVPANWAIQVKATIGDGKITSAELATLTKNLGITGEQVTGVINYLAAEDYAKSATAFLKAAERNEKNAAEFLKTETQIADLEKQKETTLQAQEALVDIAKGDVNTTLKFRNAVCKVKK
ncbi:MAG: hypothetical protein ACKO29_00665 [Actinomycetota bacterium]